MKLFIIFGIVAVCLHASLCSGIKPKTVAVLLAGSSGFGNYRHQADIAHAYKNLRRHGVEENNIIVLMYDDVSRDSENFGYNTLFNKPYSENLYRDFHIDYSHKDVTPETFLAVLRGDTEYLRERGNGRFVDVTPQDNVFIYMSDHGGFGLFGFPEDDELFADELANALRLLKTRCRKVLLFMEACESGSMFEGYLDNVEGIMAVTASNSEESSYAFYYVENIFNYLGDEFSINFLEYLEKADPSTTTVSDLVEVSKLQTKLSHVQVFGDKSLGDDLLQSFFGFKQEYNEFEQNVDVIFSENYKEIISSAPNSIESKFVQRTIAREKLKKNPKDRESLSLLKTEKKIDKIFNIIKKIFPIALKNNLEDEINIQIPVFSENTKKCYSESIHFFNKQCYSANKYNIIYSYYKNLYQLCTSKVPTRDILAALSNLCPIAV